MTDLAAKQEALDPDLIGFDGRGNITLPRKAFETVHAAARSYVRLAEAVSQLRQAIEDEGPQPRYHREIMKRHRREWPTLWAAIDAVLRGDE